MTLLLAGLCGCVLFCAILFGSHWLERRRTLQISTLQAVAKELGLRCEVSAWRHSLSGKLREIPVRADFFYEVAGADGQGDGVAIQRVQFSAGAAEQIPRLLSVHKDSMARSLGRLVEGRDELVGDPEFDALVELANLDALVCAALSQGARQQLTLLVERGGEVQNGTVVLRRLVHEFPDSRALTQTLSFCAKLAGLLSVTPANVHERLASNALHDPSRGVRLRNLRFLCDPAQRFPATLIAETARGLLGDVDPQVRLLAARQLGEQGHGVLAALAESPKEPAGLRIEALQALAEQNGSGLEPLLESLLEPPLAAASPELLCAALSLVAARPESGLARRAEPLLIGLLAADAPEVQHASAEALGAVGRVTAVEPLSLVAEGTAPARVRQAARGAIGRIQSRLGDADAGRLSLAEDHTLLGALDLATAADRTGELSIADEETEPASSPTAAQRCSRRSSSSPR